MRYIVWMLGPRVVGGWKFRGMAPNDNSTMSGN